MSYAIEYGEVPKRKLVCHHCDNPPCVNPHHLFLGTVEDNIQDAVKKGRLNEPKGEDNPKNILSKDQILDIVERLKNNEPSHKIAEDYPVSEGAIANIKTGKNWSHITGIDKPIGLRNKKVTDKEVKKICERYIIEEENITQPELAKEYDISIIEVRRILHGDRRKGVDRPTKNDLTYRSYKLSVDEVKKICHRYIESDEQITQKELAEEYDIAEKYLNELLNGKYRENIDRPVIGDRPSCTQGTKLTKK